VNAFLYGSALEMFAGLTSVLAVSATMAVSSIRRVLRHQA
jgi:hypothetical protein